MLSSMGALADPSLSPVLASDRLWAASLGGIGLWCRRLSRWLAALERVSTLSVA